MVRDRANGVVRGMFQIHPSLPLVADFARFFPIPVAGTFFGIIWVLKATVQLQLSKLNSCRMLPLIFGFPRR